MATPPPAGAAAALGAIVNDVIPNGTTFYSARANKGRFTSPVVGQTGTFTWYVGDIADATDQSAQIEVTVAVKGKLEITNTASVSSSSPDPDLANNAASLTVSVATSGGTGGGGRRTDAAKKAVFARAERTPTLDNSHNLEVVYMTAHGEIENYTHHPPDYDQGEVVQRYYISYHMPFSNSCE